MPKALRESYGGVRFLNGGIPLYKVNFRDIAPKTPLPYPSENPYDSTVLPSTGSMDHPLPSYFEKAFTFVLDFRRKDPQKSPLGPLGPYIGGHRNLFCRKAMFPFVL